MKPLPAQALARMTQPNINKTVQKFIYTVEIILGSVTARRINGYFQPLMKSL